MPLQSIELILAFTTAIEILISAALHVKTARQIALLQEIIDELKDADQ